MAIKGIIEPDIMPVNKFQLSAQGLPPLVFSEVTGIESELDTTETPDRTPQTGGREKPIEFELMQPMHHTTEVEAMEVWFDEGHDPVSPLHKKVVTLTYFSQSGLVQRAYLLEGCFPFKRGLPDAELDNDGEAAFITWGMKASEVVRLS